MTYCPWAFGRSKSVMPDTVGECVESGTCGAVCALREPECDDGPTSMSLNSGFCSQTIQRVPPEICHKIRHSYSFDPATEAFSDLGRAAESLIDRYAKNFHKVMDRHGLLLPPEDDQ